MHVRRGGTIPLKSLEESSVKIGWANLRKRQPHNGFQGNLQKIELDKEIELAEGGGCAWTSLKDVGQQLIDNYWKCRCVHQLIGDAFERAVKGKTGYFRVTCLKQLAPHTQSVPWQKPQTKTRQQHKNKTATENKRHQYLSILVLHSARCKTKERGGTRTHNLGTLKPRHEVGLKPTIL